MKSQPHFLPVAGDAEGSRNGAIKSIESSSPDRTGQVILLIIWIPLIRLFSIWLPYPVSAGISSFLIILVAYQFQPENKQSGFVGWAVRSVIYAAIITGIAYIVSPFFS